MHATVTGAAPTRTKIDAILAAVARVADPDTAADAAYRAAHRAGYVETLAAEVAEAAWSAAQRRRNNT